MDAISLTSMLSNSMNEVPTSAAVFAVQTFTLDELRARAASLLASLPLQSDNTDVGPGGGCRSDRGNWTSDDTLTTVHLAQGARAVLYHASGAVEFRSGLAPFEATFAAGTERELLTRLVAASAARIDLKNWTGEQGTLSFERLWQMKAHGADRSGKTTDALLTRVVGAFRHSVAGIPVLGGASVALRLAGDGSIDALTLRIRPSAGEVIDTAKIIAPESAARQLALQLSSLLGCGKESVPGDVVREAKLQFGYLDLGKRKAQEVLAPAYVAQITLQHRMEKQAYILAVPATERCYQQQLQVAGQQGLATGARRCG
jgi:hypothetical protein